MKTVLLTGATGFVGSALTERLHQRHYTVRAAVRRISDTLPSAIQQITIGDLLPDTAWIPSLDNVDTVIHLAARVHIMRDTATNPLTEFRNTNTVATINLAQQASTHGVRRFIYLSSIKVNGENSRLGTPFTAEDEYIPTDPYGLSKYKAEQGLRKIAASTGMEVIIIRPSLVYGPGVKANFLSMMQWLQKGIPLPLGAINNQRSLVALDSLVDLITTCIDHPNAANQTFMISDGEDISTTELLQCMGQALGKPARLLPIPQGFLTTSLKLLGKEAIARRLCNSLQVDITKTREVLGWNPVINVDEALAKTAQYFLANNKANKS